MNVTKLFTVDEPLCPDLGIARFISDFGRRHRANPTFLFNAVAGFPGFRIVTDLLKREILLRSLAAPAEDHVRVLGDRLRAGAAEVAWGPAAWTRRLPGLDALPILRHQPGDAGRYLTSAVTCLNHTGAGVFNLGFYRARVLDADRLAMFVDARTDAHRILRAAFEAGRRAVPVTLFMGGPLATYLASAAALPEEVDSFEAAARLQARPLVLAPPGNGWPPAPAEAEVVLRGRVLQERAAEAPFGEFKGYYCEPTQSPVVEIDEVWCRPDPVFLALLCGKEGGLTLMSLQNEILLFNRLRADGFEVERVTYPLDALGEFLAVVQSPSPSAELIRAVFDADRRTKLVVAAQDVDATLRKLAIFDFVAITGPYMKRGERRGDRIGLLVRRYEEPRWVEL